MREIGIGIIGAGTVGGGVVKILDKRIEELRKEQDIPIRLLRIVDKDPGRFALLPVGSAVCSTDANDILNDTAIQIVVELVGGTTVAKELVLSALSRKKHVVTANKALVAEFGPELFEAAAKNGVSVYFEASVGGGIPVIKAIREGLAAGNDIFSVKTIINGTCNYILTKMTSEQLPFKTALKDAQAKGYAEADPALDIGGVDTAHKITILASLVSRGYVPFRAVSVEGITTISKDDIAYARELGYTIKLLGIIKKNAQDGQLDVRVHPAMLHNTHILASVSDIYNAVLIEGDAVGQILLYGRGAGEMPTASAVVSDIVDVGRNIAGGSPVRIPMHYYRTGCGAKLKPIEEVESRYYLRFSVADKPGVFASIATLLGEGNISLASVMQKEIYPDKCKGVPVVMLTHPALEKNIRAALAVIASKYYTKEPTQVIKIEE